ncbi:MAG TPA: CpXC domain-containing protein [Ideonella sp.]|nr:CpXC domain-containing protein [Ideonella sp.]
MSLFMPLNLSCPKCGHLNNAPVAGSINADRRPDLRQAILENRFQDTTCSQCGTGFRAECNLNLLDMGRQQWIAALPARSMVEHLKLEEDALKAFDKSFGAGAAPAAREIGSALAMRTVFGWPALREKLLLRDLGLDDVVVECMKVELLRRLPEAPLSPGNELRLVGLDERTLAMAWVDALSEEVLETMQLDRALYDAIAQDPAGWAEVRAALTLGPFVDMQRLFMGAGRETAIGPQAIAA